MHVIDQFYVAYVDMHILSTLLP